MAHLFKQLFFTGSCFVNRAVLAGLCTLIACAALRAQDAPAPAASASAVDDLALKQSQVADKYKRLEELMFKMAALEAGTNPRRAALLTRAVEQSKEKLTKAQLETLVKLIGQKQLKRALDEQTAVQTDLKSLLELLMSEDRSDRLKSEQARIREYIKEVERLIRLEKSIQGQTEGGGDEKRLAKDQGELAKRTGDLAQKIKENEEGATPGEESEPSERKSQEDGDAKPQDGKPNEGKPSEGKPGDSKPEESKGEGKPEEGKPSGDDKGQQGKPDDGKPQDDKGEKAKPEDAKSKAKPEDSQGEKSTPQESKGKPSDGKSKSQKGKPQEGKGEPGEPQQGESGEQQEQDQQAQQDNPARKRIEQAQQKMRDAQQKLEQAKRKESIEDQRQAKEELEKAKAELEQILRQLREEEIGRTLAMLEARFRKMLEMQLRVYESTRRLDQVTQQNRNEQFVVQSGKLAIDERKIAVEAQKALTLLQEEGSSVAFPASVEAMHEDMDQVANRLADTKVDDITVGIEEDIIAALEEMIEALQKAQQDMEKQQQQQQQQQQGQEQDQSLVDEIAELKMIKALQERVNKRTVRYARLLEDDQDAVGQADDAELVDALKKLSERQQEIFRITRDIVLGKNK